MPALSVSVCGAESRFVTITVSPGLTVRVPEKAKFLMMMPFDAGSAVEAVVPEGAVVVVGPLDDELHAAIRITSAAAAASG